MKTLDKPKKASPGRRAADLEYKPSPADLELLRHQQDQLGFRLHPLAERLPVPSEKDIYIWQARLTGGWKGTVAYITIEGVEYLLVGLPVLLAWHALKEKIKDTPTAIPPLELRDVAPENAVLEIITYIAQQTSWSDSRRAAMAALYALEVRAELRRFQVIAGLETGRSGTTDFVLGELSGTSGPLIALARRIQRDEPAEFFEVLRGNRAALPQMKQIKTFAAASASNVALVLPTKGVPVRKKNSKKEGCVPHNLSFDYPGVIHPIASYVIIDANYPWVKMPAQFIDRDAIFAYVCSPDTIKENNFPIDIRKNLEAASDRASQGHSLRLFYRGASLAVRRPGELQPDKLNAHLCLVLWFTRWPQSHREGFPFPTQPLFNSASDEPPSEAGVYDNILKAAYRNGRNQVFAPYAEDNEKHNVVIDAIVSACSRCGCQLSIL